MSDEFREQIKRVRALLYTHLLPIARERDFTTIDESTKSILVEVKFSDGSRLESLETFLETAKGVKKAEYAYTYERTSGFFFQYGNERTGSGSFCALESARKPVCHLHVGALKAVIDKTPDLPAELREHDGPHYYSGEVNLEDILAIIIVNFFASHGGIIEHLELRALAN